MVQDISFNPVTDICATVPSLSVDLGQAIETGVVLDTGTVGEFNNIEDPSGVWTRVRDAFHAADLQRTIQRAAASSVKSAASSSSATAPANNSAE